VKKGGRQKTKTVEKGEKDNKKLKHKKEKNGE
jgi:hypothetical protein